eukprot:c20295_g1_i2 orf=219-2018(-)
MQLGFKATALDRDLVFQAMDVVKLYVEGLKLSKDLDTQENMHGEELVTLAATSLIQLFLRTRHPGYVVEAIVLLEFGLAVQKYSFQYKIMLISLFSTVFCSSIAFEWYKTLDVKNILIETLSHHMLIPLMRSMLWPELSSMLSETLKFHEDYTKEAADLVIVAYRHCNYSKVLEFVQFKDRLQHSHNLLLTKVEGSILQISQMAGALDDVMLVLEKLDHGNEPLKWGTDENLAVLSFNEALETRPWWSPSPGECMLTETNGEQATLQHREAKEQSLQREDSWRRAICKRCLLPRLLYLSLHAVDFRDGDDRTAKSHADELKCLLEKYAKCLGLGWEKLEDLFADISTLKSYSMSLKVEASDIFSLALFWTSYQIMSQSGIKGLICLIDLAKYFSSQLTSFAKISDATSWKPSHSDIVASWSSLPLLVPLVTEAFTWYSICLQMWLKCLQPSGKTGKKKKKGTMIASSLDTSANGGRSTVLVELQTTADAFCNHLETLKSWLTMLSKGLKASYSRVFLEYLEEGTHSKILVACDAIPMPGLVFNALQSSLSSTDYMGERLASAVQTYQPDPIINKMVNSQCATLQSLSGVIASIQKGLHS